MKNWRFSWRAIGAWLGAAVIAGVVFGLALAACNAWADPSGRDLSEFADVAATIAAVAAVLFVLVGGLALLIVSFVAPLLKAPRPLTESILLAAAFALMTTFGGVSFTLTAAAGPAPPDQHPAAFIVAFVIPAACGVLMALLYRRLPVA